MTCETCHGTGWCSSNGNGNGVMRCTCWRQHMVTDLLGEANIPTRFRACTFESFVTYKNNEPLLRAVKQARAFAQSFPVVQKGLLFIGQPGIGKTHLAVSVLQDVITQNTVRGLYYDTRTLLSTIRSTFDPITRASDANVLQRVMSTDILVLDDLGAERPTDWVEETMNLIVNTRYNERRPTLFTTNYEDVSDVDDTESLGVRVGFRMHSRLREMCEFLEYQGPDYREFEYPPSADDIARRWKDQKRQARRRPPPRTTGRARGLTTPGAQLELGWEGGRASHSGPRTEGG